MTLSYAVTVKNARLDSVESTIGTAPTLTIRTGSAPTNADATATGTVLATCTLPSDWMAAASGGTKAKSGTWEDTSADATGTAGYFRITGSGGALQGTVTATGGGGDMTVDSTSFTAGQAFTVTTFTLTSGN
jgi:hypothetical protein